jgi:hypothetical protein
MRHLAGHEQKTNEGGENKDRAQGGKLATASGLPFILLLGAALFSLWWLASSRVPATIFDLMPAETTLLYYGTPGELEKINSLVPLSLPNIPPKWRDLPVLGVFAWQSAGREQIIFFREDAGEENANAGKGRWVRRGKWVFVGEPNTLRQWRQDSRNTLRRKLALRGEEATLWQTPPLFLLRQSILRKRFPQLASFFSGEWLWFHWSGSGRERQVLVKWDRKEVPEEKRVEQALLPALRISRPVLLLQWRGGGEIGKERRGAGFDFLQRMIPAVAEFPPLHPQWTALVIRHDGVGLWLSLSEQQRKRLKDWMRHAAARGGGREEKVQTRWGTFWHLVPVSESLLSKEERSGRIYWRARKVTASGGDLLMGERKEVAILATKLKLAEEMLAALQEVEEREWQGQLWFDLSAFKKLPVGVVIWQRLPRPWKQFLQKYSLRGSGYWWREGKWENLRVDIVVNPLAAAEKTR